MGRDDLLPLSASDQPPARDAAGDRPQESLEKSGPAALSDTELLAMLLRSGTRGQDVLTLAAAPDRARPVRSPA